jgi:plasmid stabilization system protein ParE
MLRLKLHEEAERELTEAAAYLERERPEQGERLLRIFQEKCDLVRLFPNIGHRARDDLRVFPLNAYRSDIIYAPLGDVLFVLAVAHQRRRPGYWHDRL